MSKRRMTSKAAADIKESEDTIKSLEEEIEDIQREMEDALEELEQKWDALAEDVTEIPVTPYKKDITASLFGVAWFPYYLMQDGSTIKELPGFTNAE
jgi:predicted RNase H-like nuclease (RuvC/YqgF family)